MLPSIHPYHNVGSRLGLDIVLRTDRGDRSTGNFAEAHNSTNIRTTFFPENKTLNPPVASMACSNQSRLDSDNTVATSTSFPKDWDPLRANPLLLGYPQIWEHSASLIDARTANGIFVLHDYGPEIDSSQCQLAHSFLPIPHIDWGSYQESPLTHTNQAPIPVSTISPMYPQSA